MRQDEKDKFEKEILNNHQNNLRNNNLEHSFKR